MPLLNTPYIRARSPIKMLKVILTRELGRLSKWLRIVGFDAEYYDSDNVSTLIIRALREDRTVITRRKSIGNLKVITVNQDDVRAQLREILAAFSYQPRETDLFRRCVVCNQELIQVEKAAIQDKVPEYVYATQSTFFRCPKCRRLYWKGSHWEHVQAFLQDRS